MTGILEQIDNQLEQLLAGWNLWSSILVCVVLLVLAYPVLIYKEADTHPLLLSRQSNVAMVRMPGESAVYRSLEVPHGIPLKSGLNVKEEGQGRWVPGKDGNLKDVWRRVVNGTVSDDGKATGHKATIKTVYGREEIETHDNIEMTKQLNSIGKYIQNRDGIVVAMCLPNSVELLLALFASAFYGFHPILIPYGIPQSTALKLVATSNANFIITQAGTIPMADIKAACKNVKQILWVVEKTSRHMDWNEEDNKVGSSTWHEVVEQSATGSSESLPPHEEGKDPPGILTVWLDQSFTSAEMVEFTHQNIVSAVAAQISALPLRHRLSHEDLFLPADSITQPHVLAQTLAALYSGASVALNSVAGPEVDLASAVMGITPTIMAASAASALKLHEKTKTSITGNVQKFALTSQKQALQSGYMPPTTVGSGVIQPTRATLGQIPHKLRLLYVFDRVESAAPTLSPDVLSELRAFTGARVVYGLIAPKVAGTITQTQFYDYRKKDVNKDEKSHFGAPVSSVEIKLVDTSTHKSVEGEDPTGEIHVNGPAVAGGEVNIGVAGRFNYDGTLAFA